MGHDTKSGDFVHVPEFLATLFRQIRLIPHGLTTPGGRYNILV